MVSGVFGFTNCKPEIPDGPYSQDRRLHICRRGLETSAPPRPRGELLAAPEGMGAFEGGIPEARQLESSRAAPVVIDADDLRTPCLREGWRAADRCRGIIEARRDRIASSVRPSSVCMTSVRAPRMMPSRPARVPRWCPERSPSPPASASTIFTRSSPV